VIGIRESARFNDVIVAVKRAVIFLFLVPTALLDGELGDTGKSRRPVHPTQRRHRNLWLVGRGPRRRGGVFRLYRVRCGLPGSLVIYTILYVAVGFVLTGIVPFRQIERAGSDRGGIDAAGIGWLAPLTKLGIVLGLTSVSLVSLLGQPLHLPRYGA
jgi:APA family basic amino acid/polyamine antiporter